MQPSQETRTRKRKRFVFGCVDHAIPWRGMVMEGSGGITALRVDSEKRGGTKQI